MSEIPTTPSVFDEPLGELLRQNLAFAESPLTGAGTGRRSSVRGRADSTKRNSLERVHVGFEENPLGSPSSSGGFGSGITQSNSLDFGDQDEGDAEDKEEYREIRYGQDLELSQTDRERLVTMVSSNNTRRVSLFDVPIDMLASAEGFGFKTEDISRESNELLVVCTLVRTGCSPGPAEKAGIRLGDVVVGVNYLSTALMSPAQVDTLPGSIDTTETPDAPKTMYLQCWRTSGIQEEHAPGLMYVGGEHSFVFQSYTLEVEGVLNREERSNFMGILLHYMKHKSKQVFRKLGAPKKCGARRRASYESPGKLNNFLFDMEQNILRAKMLRPVLCARVVAAKRASDSMQYVMRVEDVESGNSWIISRRFRDFFALQERLVAMDLGSLIEAVPALPAKMNLRKNSAVVEMRIVGLEDYIRGLLALLSSTAAMDRKATDALRTVQTFLGTSSLGRHVLFHNVDDQRSVELTVFRYLNDATSQVSAQCRRFVRVTQPAELVRKGPDGYVSLLKHVNEACSEVCDFITERYGDELFRSMKGRRPSSSRDKISQFVVKCIRRQVECCIFLPLRRSILHVMRTSASLDQQMTKLNAALEGLAEAPPSMFGVPDEVLSAATLPLAVTALREAFFAYIPLDQRLMLLPATKAMVDLHTEVLAQRHQRQMEEDSRRSTGSQGELGTSTSASASASASGDEDDSGRGNGSDGADMPAEGRESGAQQAAPTLEDGGAAIAGSSAALSADDFLPLFTLVLSRVGLKEMLIFKEVMLYVGDEGDSLGEIGYYMATLEAACVHLAGVAENYADGGKVV